ncbi:MAG: DUF58 domain-containing protein [Peptococcaceae bacterium]|jgi:uncharacterized protein (DUF58 family)|nr:DUF58 domain-containing protein [Peptococcaceae bacterium]MDH7523766.1 DUF58 domain-containing protein [Peptococcaceae bacterium]
METTSPGRAATSVFTIPFIRYALYVGVVLLIVNRNLPPAAFLLFLIITLECARFWCVISVRKLEVGREIGPQRLFRGEETVLTLEIKNKKLIPVSVFWEQPISREFEVISSAPGVMHSPLSGKVFLGWHAEFQVRYVLKGVKRGYFRLPPLTVSAGDGLSLFKKEKYYNDKRVLIVYPRVFRLEDLSLTPAFFIGEKKDDRPFLPDPVRIAGLRDYSPDMPARLIHWKASAYKNELLAKVLEPSADVRICIAVDVGAFYGPLPQPERFEEALSLAASLVYWADCNKVQYGLLANGAQKELPCQVVVPISSSASQAATALESLARLELEPLGTLTDLVRTEGRHFPWGTTLVVIGDGTPLQVSPNVRNVVYYNAL